MNILFHHQYVTCLQSEDERFFEILWLPKSVSADKASIIAMTEEMLSNVRKLDLVLVDARQMFFTIDPNFQIEYGEYSTQKFIALGCKKLAVVLPEDFVSNLSVQQLVDEVEDMKFNNMFQTRYFGNVESAKEWLNSLLFE